MKLWQMNKYHGPAATPSSSELGPLRYWFTKVKEWMSHRAPVLHTVVSPDGQYVATLANDIKETTYETEPTFRIWDIFEKIEDDAF
jgi:WD40 repeat protein